MLIPIIHTIKNTGYVAGTSEGVVTVGGTPASRKVYALDAVTLGRVQTTKSLPSGHYLITNLDPSKQYLIMARDYNKEYEPAAWDYVTPSTDLTIAEQQELWESWQNANY